MKIAFDNNHNPIMPSIILANRNGNRLGLLSNVYNIVVNGSIDTPEMSFKVLKEDNGQVCNLWDSIKDFKLIWCKEWDMWFEIAVELQDGSDRIVKSITATALCQSELSQIMLYEIEINTEDDIARDDYKIPTTIYNPEHSEASLLNRITEKIPHYSIEHVDASLMNIQRTFKFDGKSIKDALDEIAEEIECLVVYGNTTSDAKINGISVPKRTISLYDLKCVCSECGYRGDNTTICPECGSKIIIDGYGSDTNIFISKDNLTDNITFTSDVDSVKNCFHLVAGDDLMTTTIRNCNPNGSSYIWYISDSVKEDMPEELVAKLDKYDSTYKYYKDSVLINDIDVIQYNTLVNKYKSLNSDLQTINQSILGYLSLMKALYETIDFKLYLNDSLLPSISTAKKTAKTQAVLLTSANLSPIAVSNISVISSATVDSNVLAMAKIIAGSNFRVKINDSSFNKNTLIWKGNFVVANYSDEDDTATSATISIQISDDYEKYVKQRLDKILTDEDTEDYSISELFAKKLSVTQGNSGVIYSGGFMTSLGYYALAYLKNIYNCCQSCLDILVEQGVADGETWGNSTPNLYQTLYLDYYNKLAAIEYEMNVRESELQIIENTMNSVSSKQEYIQDKLDFKKFIGDDLWNVFISYRRDDEYSNNNYISDGLNNAELFNKALEFIDVAEKEIVKAATVQHTLSSTLKNLLVIKEFEKLLDYFEVGNWLRINIDDDVYKLRLLSYDIDFDNLAELNVEFSDVVYIGDIYSDTKSIANTVSSIASSYDYVTRQATNGNNANKTISEWTSNGLDATVTKIVNNADNQDIVYDSHGLLFRSYDFMTNSYLPTQLKIINSTLAITNDNWETTKTAVGNFYYNDPVTGELQNAYGINAEVLIGKLLLGEELKIYNESGNLTFDNNGLSVTNGINTITINPNENSLFTISNKNKTIINFDENGDGHFNGSINANSGTIGGWTIDTNELKLVLDEDSKMISSFSPQKLLLYALNKTQDDSLFTSITPTGINAKGTKASGIRFDLNVYNGQMTLGEMDIHFISDIVTSELKLSSQGLYMTDDNYEMRLQLNRSSVGNLVLGYGQYEEGTHNTNIYGGSGIHFFLKNPNISWYPYYKKGDSFNVNWHGAGYITNGSKQVNFSLPLSKPVINVSLVSVSATSGVTIRQNGNYLYGSSASDGTKSGTYTASVATGGNSVNVSITFTDTTNVINNDVCGIYANLKITFN